MTTIAAAGRATDRRAVVAALTLALLLTQVAVAAPTATLQGTDDHDTQWRVDNLSNRLALLENQAQAGQSDLFAANCRHMDDSLFTIKNRIAQLPEGDRVKIFISHSPVQSLREALDEKKQKQQGLTDTAKQYLQAISSIDQKIAAGVNKFQIDWLKALFGQLKPATGIPKWYELPKEFWDWYQESEQAGQDLANDLNTVQKLSNLRDALRERWRKAMDEAQQLKTEIETEEAQVAGYETAFNAVVAKYGFVVVGSAPPQQTTQPPELSIVFLVDCSGSMAGDKLDAARAAIRSSVGRTDDGKTEWALLGFGSCSFWEEIGFTQTAADVTAAADALSAGGDTPLTFSTYKAITYIARNGRGQARRLIVLCDGQDNCEERGSTTQEDAMDGLRTIVRDVPGGTQP